MALSSELVSQFVKATKDETKKKNETTVYGEIVEYNGKKYVRLDGSDQLTPYETTADADTGDRVSVLVKNHSATVTGNLSDPSAKGSAVEEIGNQITEVEILVADKVSTKELEVERGRIDDLISDNILVKEKLTATEAEIGELTADNVTIKEQLTASNADIENLKATKLDVDIANAKYATIADLDATNATIHNLDASYGEFKVLATDKFSAIEADIQTLDTEKLSAESAAITYATIDFSNIGQAAIENLFSDSGLIKDLVVGDGTITGELVGVTISGDLIEGNTIKADKLVVKGSDGLYYKLNVDGESVEAEQTEYNSLNGSVITAKSITATKIAVSDLVAFDATIAGMELTEGSIYSGVKNSALNTTRGFYIGKDGQMAVGDSNNFLRYYKTETGEYRLEISAGSISFGSSDKNLETELEKTVTSTSEEFYQSDNPATLSGGSWSSSPPDWQDGKYVWRRTLITYGDGTTKYSPSENGVCITGNDGTDAVILQILSSNGSIFKNTEIATTLSAHVYKGGVEITGSTLTALGTIRWYKDGGTTAIATGTSLTIQAGDVLNNANYTAQLEG